MDFDEIGSNLPIIVIALALILFQFFMRRRPKQEKTPREIATSLLAEVARNLHQVESFQAQSRMGRFLLESWSRNKNRLDFLGRELQNDLSDAYMIAEDLNRQIEMAKKQKSSVYMATLDVEKLRGPLTRSKEGLEQWLVDNFGSQEPPVEYPGIMDSLFGAGPKR
ncbi:hypothetical protein ACFLYX_01930 [Chloroflexota bacterium]